MAKQRVDTRDCIQGQRTYPACGNCDSASWRREDLSPIVDGLGDLRLALPCPRGIRKRNWSEGEECELSSQLTELGSGLRKE